MALRYDRRFDPAFQAPPGDGVASSLTAGDVARSLRRTRSRQGLSIKDVSARTGIPLTQLRAAETGVLLPDQLAALKTVRRYADYLGLPGDRFALALLEHWPTKASVVHGAPGPGAPTSTLHDGGAGPMATAEVAALSHPDMAGDHPTVAGVAAVVDGAGDPATLSLQAVAPVPPRADEWTAGYGPYTYGDTGVTPAVRAPTRSHRPRRRAPRALQALVAVVAVAVVLTLAVLATDRLRPSWLRAIGITAATRAPASARTGPVAAPAAGRSTSASSAATATGSHPKAAKASATSATRGGPLTPVQTSGSTVRYNVPASVFTLRVAAVGPCWVDVTSPSSSQPLYVGMLYAGQSKSFTAQHDISVQTGSSAGRLSLTAGGKHLLTTVAPKIAPVTTSFHAAR